MSLLDPEELQQRFIWWMRACQDVTDGAVVAIDGKTVRRSFDKKKGKSAIHMVSTFCAENRQVLGQRKTDVKENEIIGTPNRAIPQWLDLLDIGFEWPKLQTLGVAVSLRQEAGKAADIAVCYYISSAELTAEAFGKAARAHWSIESSLHWCLDVGMREDECRIRRGKAAENLAAVRHIAFNLLKQETTKKGGIQRKRKHAARKTDYLSKVIEAA